MNTSKKPVIDASAWIGAYPFRSTTPRDPNVLIERMDRLTIDRAIVGSFESLFWEDNLVGYECWRDRLPADRLELWPVVNPSLPGQLRRFGKLHDDASAAGQPFRGLRLLPNYHGYHLHDAHVADLMQLARERDLVVQVFQRIADERWHWMLHVPAVEDEELTVLINQFPANRLLICGSNQPELFADAMRQHPALYLDISRVRCPVFAIEHLIEKAPWQRLVMGSLWPIQIIEATLWQVEHAEVAPHIMHGILGGNAERLLDASNAKANTSETEAGRTPAKAMNPSPA